KGSRGAEEQRGRGEKEKRRRRRFAIRFSPRLPCSSAPLPLCSSAPLLACFLVATHPTTAPPIRRCIISPSQVCLRPSPVHCKGARPVSDQRQLNMLCIATYFK